MAADASYRVTELSAPSGAGEVSQMDPRLQMLMAFRQHGQAVRAASISTSADEVAVVAKVSDVAAWEALSEVHAGAVIGDADAAAHTIVTARIPIARIEFVRTRPFVVSLKAAQRLSAALHNTVPEILAPAADLPAGNKAKGGKGVVVGIVDSGCDIAHKNLCTAAGKTRVLKLWNQRGAGVGEGTFRYGAVHTAAKINTALAQGDPYTKLQYPLNPAEPAHGTHVTDIAAGNGKGSGKPGVAPEASIIFVDIAATDVPWSGPDVVGTSFGDSVQLLEALAFIFESAGTKPCVINVSLGTNGGPHDGSTLVEQGIDRMIRQAPNRAVVIAASNSFADGIHAAGTVPRTGKFDLTWNVAPGDWTDNELELWFAGTSKLSVEILAPDGSSVGTLAPGKSATVSQAGQVVLFAANRLGDPNNGDNVIGVFLNRRAPTGRWTLRLKSASSPKAAVPFHAWIERDDRGQSTFSSPLDNAQTIGSISCGHDTIVVGSYDASKPAKPLSWFSSAGPTRDGREKPEVSAPGHDVQAAASRSLTGVVRMSGTSMAAPAVTGAVALMLASAAAKGRSLTIDEVRAAVIETARDNPPAAGPWDPRYGHGRVSAAGLVGRV
ncbi:MAG: S8 family serine peptidase [Acidimicrobiales bacterium]